MVGFSPLQSGSEEKDPLNYIYIYIKLTYTIHKVIDIIIEVINIARLTKLFTEMKFLCKRVFARVTLNVFSLLLILK